MKSNFNNSLTKYTIKLFQFNKIYLGIIVNFFLTVISFSITSYLLQLNFNFEVFTIIILFRSIYPFIFFNDYKLSWSKATSYSAFIKFFINTLSLISYSSIFFIFFENFNFSLLIFEYLNFLFLILLSIFIYNNIQTKSSPINNTNNVIIYGSGRAGISVYKEISKINKVKYFIDDNIKLHFRSIDGIPILSRKKVINDKNLIKYTMIIAMPSAKSKNIKRIYNYFKNKVSQIKILPPSSMVYRNKPFISQLKKISIIDLLARNPKDLDKKLILNSLKNKIILITGSSGTIGGELLKLSIIYKAKKIIAVDHNEFGQYEILEKNYKNVDTYVSSILDKNMINYIFKKYRIDIVIHAAAYKHVHLSEKSISSTILNNVIGTKNMVDLSIINKVPKFVLISTDKAVNPTNVMGATKSIAELYCQNVNSKSTSVISVRFGNVLGSSGSVIPKFQKQIDNDHDITVTHKDITRYFMLVEEACNLVLQSSAIGKNSEILILDMGKPIKISELAQKMIDLSEKKYLKIKYTGLRKGEKLYEELLFDDTEKKTKYESITIAKRRDYEIKKLNEDIDLLLKSDIKDKIKFINKILPDFNHLRDNKSILSNKELKEFQIID